MNFIESYYNAIKIQQEQQSQEFDETQSLPLMERILKGTTMINLSVKFDFYDDIPTDRCTVLEGDLRYIRLVHVFCPYNYSKFREGDTVRLSHGQYAFDISIVKDGVDEFLLKPNEYNVDKCFIDSVDYPQNNWQVDALKNDVNFRLLKCTGDWLSEHSAITERITNLLDGNYQPHIATIDYSNEHLNDSQNKAVAHALGTDYVHLIQGPPGTGKTYTIAYLCQQLLNQGNNVFITAPTHTAINNSIEKIAQVVQNPLQVLKVGERYQAGTLVLNEGVSCKRHFRHEEYVYPYDQPVAVGATPYSLCYPASKKLNEWEFDYAIMDEAAQMSIPMAVAVMAKCHHIIFVGDHQQLNPIIPTDTDNHFFDCSIFQHLVNLYPDNLTLLNESYRLNPQLLDISNRLFYHGALQSQVETVTPYCKFKCQSPYAEVITHKHNAILFCHHEFDGMGRSPFEAEVVSDIVNDLLHNQVLMEQIGIMTPYRAQVREIRQALYQRGVLNAELVQQLFVDTVDRMQGQEREYIIYSLANINPTEVEDRLEFFYDANRLNVAITRAKIKCIVIANEKVFTSSKELMQTEIASESLRRGVAAFSQFYDNSIILRNPSENEDAIWI